MSGPPEILLPYGTSYVTVEEIPALIANALHPVIDGVDYGDKVDVVALGWAIAQEEHERLLRQAISSGVVIVRNPASRIPLSPLAMPSAVLLLDDFTTYAKRFGISVAIDFVSISDLLNPLAEQLVAAHPERWWKEGLNNDVRHDIAVGISVGHLQGLVKGMVDSGAVVPINGHPGPGEFLCDAPWGVTRRDAEQLQKLLRGDLSDPGWSEVNEKADTAEAQRAQWSAQDQARCAAGRYTILEASKDLERNTVISAARWKQVMLGDVKTGKLPLRNPQNYVDRLPYPMPDTIRAYYDQVDADGLNGWLDAHPEWSVSYRFPSATRHSAQATRRRLRRYTGIADELQDKREGMPPLQRQAHQEQEVLRVIRKLGYDPEALPRRAGFPGVKAQVRNELSYTPEILNKAWKRLRKAGRIADAP